MRAEDCDAPPARLGVRRVELLGYRDSGFDGDLADGSLCAAPVEEVAGALGALLRELRPAGSCSSSTAATGTATTCTSASRGPPGGERGGRGGPAAGRAVPARTACCAGGWTRCAAVRPDTAYHALDPATLGRDDAEVTDVLDTTAVLDRREAAIAEHRSQVSPFEGLSDELRRAFLTSDHLARVEVPGRWP